MDDSTCRISRLEGRRRMVRIGEASKRPEVSLTAATNRGKGRAAPRAAGPKLDPHQSYHSAMGELIGQRWGDVWKALPGALAGDDIEGVHQVRVASRRLRAAMDVAVDCFPISWYRPLHEAAKAITGALGEVRDRDVLIAALIVERDAVSKLEQPGLDRLIERVERERHSSRREMEAFLAQLVEGGLPKEAVCRFGPAAGLAPAADSGVNLSSKRSRVRPGAER